MSPAERFVRHHHHQTDRAVSRAFARLGADAAARSSFDALLNLARRRAPAIVAAPLAEEHHTGVEALEQLARSHSRYVRQPLAWPGSDAGWQGAVAALAQHLLGAHPVPPFLASAWHVAGDDPTGATQRTWFVEHGAGRRFRSLDLPLRMTRRMEHVFLQSPAHLTIPCALRRAELLALGVEPGLVETILATRPGLDLGHGDFWRTAWMFLVAHAREIPRDRIAPLIDFFDGVRHERTIVETPAGPEVREPLDPDFSLRGRSVRSVERLMLEWHRTLGRSASAARWAPSPLQPMRLEFPAEDPALPPVEWLLVELTSAAELRTEGAALGHCVAMYSRRCVTGASRLWSLRRKRGAGTPRAVLTIEIDPRRRAIVQMRGRFNRLPAGRPFQIVRNWATRERLRILRL